MMRLNKCKMVYCSLLALMLTGCGTMKVKETYYYAVEDETNTNVYRLKIEAKSVLGDAKYREGFFPAHAVDRAFGAVNDNSGNADLQFQETLKAQIRDATLHTTQEYLNIAKNKESSDEDILRALNARRKILAYPSLNVGLPNHTRIIEFNPAKNTVIRNSDSKMVFVLSSNPDTVIGNIKNFAESDQTALAVSKLAQVTSQRTRNEVAEKEATLQVIGESIRQQIQQSVQSMEAGKDANNDVNKTIMAEQLAILKVYLKGVVQ